MLTGYMVGDWDERVRARVLALIKKHPHELNQPILAARTGWTQPYVSDYLNGKRGIPLDVLAEFARVLGVRMADLFIDAEPQIDEVQALIAGLSPEARAHLLGLLRASAQSPPATPRQPPASRARLVGKK
jgi:transcriptional regulator with XRE-family HTH domain